MPDSDPNLVAALFDRYRFREAVPGRSYADVLPATRPDRARRFGGLADVRRAMRMSGSHYFDAGAIASFGAQTHKAYPNKGGRSLFAQRFWIESRMAVDVDGNSEREYQIAWVAEHDEGWLSIEKIGGWNSILEARAAGRALGEAVEQGEDR